MPDDLDSGVGHRRTHEKTDFLINNFDSKILWDNFGVYEGVVVCDDVHEMFPTLIYAPAIYTQLPPSRHPRAPRARPPPSNHQRCLQGPSRYLGWGLSSSCPQRESRSPNNS